MSSGPNCGPCSKADSSEMKQAFFARPFNSSKTTFLTSPDSPAFCSFMRRFLYLLQSRALYVRTESLAHTFFFLTLPSGRVGVGKRNVTERIERMVYITRRIASLDLVSEFLRNFFGD